MKKPAKMNLRFHFQAEIVGFSLSCLQKSFRIIFGFFKKVQIIVKELILMMMCIEGIQG
jgi:hypothetical protein